MGEEVMTILIENNVLVDPLFDLELSHTLLVAA